MLYEEENRNYLEYIYVLGKHFARLDGNLDNLNDTTKYFYHTDHLGSTVAVTDIAGNTIWDGEYTPFGKQVGQTGVLKRAAKFTGKELDEDIGLYYFNARWYDSETGRFVEEDSIPIDPNNPITLNRYTYCSNNPINRIDPSGHMDYATQSDDLLRGIVDGVGDQLKGLKEAPKAIMIIADGIIRGDITLKQLAEAGLESVIGDYKYILENASVFNPFQKNSDKEVYEMGKHLSGIAVDVTMAATGTGAAKLFTALSKTKSGAKIVKALKTLKTAMKDEGGYINPSAFTKKVAGNSDDLVDQRLMRLDLEGTRKTTPKTTLDYLKDIEVKNGNYYASKATIDEIGKIEAKGVDFSKLDSKVMSLRASTEGGMSRVIKYSDGNGIKFIIHEVTDAKGNIIHRDFDAVRIESGQLINKK